MDSARSFPGSTQQLQFQELFSEFSELQKRVNNLDAERANLQARMEDIMNTLRRPYIGENSTPIQLREHTTRVQIDTLPVDVLRNIFLHCLPHGSEAVMHPREAPILLGQVCASWRNLAWSAPELWVTLQVQIPVINYDPFRYENERWTVYLASIEQWLKRSNGRPLSISVVDADTELHYIDQRKSLIQGVLGILSAESVGWRSLRLCLSGGILSKPGIDPINVPMLEVLSLESPIPSIGKSYEDEGDGDIAHDEEPRIGTWELEEWIQSITSSSHLQSLRIHNLSLLGDISHALPNCQWAALRRLDIGYETPSRSHSLTPHIASTILDHLAKLGSPLQCCRMVVTFLESYSNPGTQTVASRIVLTFLQDFSVTYLDPNMFPKDDGELKNLFEALHAPSLRSFEYRTSFSPSVLPFRPFLGRATELKKLRLLIGGTRHPAREYRESCPMIEELHLAADFARARIDSYGLACFPKLKTLILDCSPPRSSESLFKDLGPKKHRAGIRSTQDVAFRRAVERDRYFILGEKLKLIEGWLQKCDEKMARKVEFRLNERLRDRALRCLAPFIVDGLCVTFKGDHYNVPPP